MAAWWYSLFVVILTIFICQTIGQTNSVQSCNKNTSGAVQLVGTEGNTGGRLEVCVNEQWGTVCNDEFDNNDAMVVCRQLGFNDNALTQVVSNIFYGEGLSSQPIHLDDLQCIGNETSLLDCEHISGSEVNCQHDEDVGLICKQSDDCTDGDVRLVDGDNTNATKGRVEYCVGGLWGTVCSLQDSEWISVNHIAAVVCRQLGFKLLEPEALSRNQVPNITNPHTPIVLQGVLCDGSETSLGECVHGSVVEHCNHSYDVGVLCVCTNNEVRLVRYEGEAENEHQVEICQNGFWNDLCGDFWDDDDAKVICREFGYNVENGESLAATDNNLGNTRTVSLIQFHCRGSESNISQCLKTNSTRSCTAPGAKVICQMEVTGSTVSTGQGTMGTTEEFIIGFATVFLLILSFITILCICLASITVIVKKRKASVRNLQLEVITSPPRTTESLELHSLCHTMKRNGTDEGGEPNRVPHASPNPYSTNEELSLTTQFLRPNSNRAEDRVNSSIIRELSSNMLIPCTRLKLMECVGQGEFGVVYKAQYTEPEGDIGYKTSTVAVKTLKGFFDSSQVNKIMEESIKMKHFDHPNVLHLIGVCLDAGPAPYVVMPYMANGSLLHYLKKERSNVILGVGVDEDVKIDVRKRLTVMCLQIATGMEYLAGEKFVHRDLAARNCMIDIHFVIKIADFGLSEDTYSKNYFRQSTSDKSIKLPVKWMAPESLFDGVFSEKSDVWSFGVTCWEVFSGGKTPYPGVDPLLLSQMLDAEQRLNKPLNAACPDEMYSLMMKCWSKQPDDRPPFSEIVPTVSNYTENIAGYLDINFNPFNSELSSAFTDIVQATVTAITPSLEMKDDIKKTSGESLAKILDSKKLKLKNSFKKLKGVKISPRGPKASPKASPKVSPQSARSLHLRDDQLSMTSSVEIEIRIQSPSDDDFTITSNSL